MGTTAASQPDAEDAHDATGRLGLAGDGVYYLLLTPLCAQLLLGTGGGQDAGAQGVVATVVRQASGQVLLAGLTLAFAAYATVRWIHVVRDGDLADRAKNASGPARGPS